MCWPALNVRTARRRWRDSCRNSRRLSSSRRPTSAGVAWTYLGLGVHHILVGIDHLLYILAMLFLVKGWRRIVATMTAFTMTHSLTLTAAALGGSTFRSLPSRPASH